MATEKKRKEPPPSMRDEVLREAGYKCGNPVCRNVLTLELHHIEWVKQGGPTIASNLVALCGHCHNLHTGGHIPASAVRHWKGLLVALNSAFSRESMDLLLYLDTENVEGIWYSGDGLLRFAGLIASGLVSIVEQQALTGCTFAKGPATPMSATSVRLGLSDKGSLLVRSWKKGDETEYAVALGYAVPKESDG